MNSLPKKPDLNRWPNLLSRSINCPQSIIIVVPILCLKKTVPICWTGLTTRFENYLIKIGSVKRKEKYWIQTRK